MQTDDPKQIDAHPIRAWINRDKGLRTLCKRVELIQLAHYLLTYQLPDPLSVNFKVVNIEHNTVKIQAQSATWGIQLRYQQQKIISILKGEPQLQHLQQVVITIAKPFSTQLASTVRQQRKVQLTDIAREKIAHFAAATENPTLKAALYRFINKA